MASEKASVSQTIDGTTLTIEYSRPSLRGRDVREDLFGDQIRWGLTWTPGANTATVIESDRDFTISGTPVPAGRWSIWMVVGPDEWEMVLDPRDDLYHIEHPEPADDQIRFPITTTRTSDSAETLSWSFTTVQRDGADLRMQWGDLAVDVAVQIEPTQRLALTEEEEAAYVGPWTVDRMSTPYVDAGTFETEFEAVDGVLRAPLSFGPDFTDTLAFVPAAEQVFRLASMINGEVAEVMTWAFVEFEFDDEGRAASFELRDTEDTLLMRGSRIR